MTREFNKQGRDDMRPSTRHSSSEGRYEGERSTRPARPRLNRAIVDRAWEEGAQTNHADYRPRSRGQAQPTDYRSNRQQQGSPSHHNGANSRRPYSNRQPREPYGYGDPQDNHQGQYEHNGNTRYPSDSRQRPGSSQEQRPYDRYPGQERPYRGNESYHRPAQDSARDDRPSRGYERGNEARRSYGESRGPRNAPTRNWGEQNRQPRQYGGGGTYEGDYERFSSYSGPHAPDRSAERERPGRNDYQDRRSPAQPRDHRPSTQPGERRVTQMPDGRVLKGSRPVQRKQAEYWKEVDQDSENLLQQVHKPATEETHEQSQPGAQEPKRRAPLNGDTPRARKPVVKKESTSNSPRSNNAREKHVGEGKPHSSGPKPSQRGFKWPTP
jgi:hypothetical protein